MHLIAILMIDMFGDINEYAFDIRPAPSRSLSKVQKLLLSFETETLLEGDLPEMLHVTFIPHEYR